VAEVAVATAVVHHDALANVIDLNFDFKYKRFLDMRSFVLD
jgi:hypothetical protein